MWSTTTRPRATSSARRCRSRASTTLYYRLLPDSPRYYINDTGTGNTLNLSHPRVIQMVTDSLRYWVHRDARRRLPLRSRHHPGARAQWLRQPERLSEGLHQDPVLRTVKLIAEPWDCRPGRLPGRRLPARLGGVERPVPRHRARFLEGDGARPATLAPRLCASADVFNQPRPQALGEHQLRHRARRLYAERPGHLQRQAQRGQRRGQPRRQQRQPVVELRRRRPDRRSRHPAPCARGRCATCWRRCCCRRARR